MKPIIIVGLMTVLEIVEATIHCDKEFNYHDNYGNGFDITCQGITKEYLHLLENITITNEISLRIENCTLNQITSKIFHNVVNVRCLFLTNSSFTYSTEQPVFEYLRRLEQLVVNNTNFHINKHTFVGSSSMKELTLNNNDLGEIETGTFKNLPALKHLEITNNQLRDLRKLPLCELRRLRCLILSRNGISSIKDIHFNCKDSNKAVNFNLNNEDHHLPHTTLPDFYTFSEIPFALDYIDLSYNKITELESSLSSLKTLRTLNLEGNKLTKINNRELGSLINLQRVHLKANLLRTVETVFHNKSYLQHLDLSSNKLTFLTLNHTPMLTWIDLSNNRLNISTVNNINDAGNISTLILNNNEFTDIKPYVFRKFTKLETLNLASNSITLYNNSFDGLSNLKYLSLNNNSLNHLSSNLFTDLAKLKQLDLSQNRIKFFVADTFKGLANIQTLNISNNILQEFHYSLLTQLHNLEVLDLGGNQLHYIQYDLIISDLPSISVLNIKSNLLPCELLYKIVRYLKKKQVGYTVDETFDYEKENVAGIHCTSGLKTEKASSETRALMVVSVIAIAVVLVAGLTVFVFKIHIYLKRRKYRADEFELIDE